MKNVFATLVVLISLGFLSCGSGGSVSGSTQESLDKEQEAIKQVVQHYLDVTDKKDHESIRKAFHPDAKLMSVNSSTGDLTQMNQEDWWARTSRASGTRTSKISLIDVTGIAAVVRVDFSRSSDYISLLKFGDEWKIVNKVLSTKL